MPKRSPHNKRKRSPQIGILKLRPLDHVTSVVEDILKLSTKREEPLSPILEKPKRIRHSNHSATLPIKSINLSIDDSPHTEESPRLLLPLIYNRPLKNDDVETRSIGINVEFPSDSTGFLNVYKNRNSDLAYYNC